MKRLTIALTAAFFALGALVPWLPTAGPVDAAPAEAAPRTSSPTPLPDPAEQRKPPSVSGILAVGDERMHSAKDCLEERGIDVYPRSIRDADELLEVLQMTSRGYAAVLVHLEGDPLLVDGDIERALSVVDPVTRVVWATVHIDYLPWGAFSPEERINASLRNVVKRHPEGRLLEWRSATVRHPEWHLGDRTLSTTGCNEYARKVIKASGGRPRA